MQNRLSVGFAALLLTVFVAGSDTAFGNTPSRLESLAARQNLCDQVCIMMADGKISARERAEILLGAKQVLGPEEYRVFKQALNRLSPPPKKPARKKSVSVKTARKKSDSVKIARKSSVPKPRPKPEPAAKPFTEPSLGPVIPAGAVLPDRMVSIGSVR